MNTNFGARVRAARIERGLVQVELALAVACAPSHISNIENGYIEPTPELQSRIGEYLRMSPYATPLHAPPRAEPRLKAGRS